MEQKQTWGGGTNPSQHDEKKFRYLIHAFNPLAKSSMGLLNTLAALSKIQRGEGPHIDKAHGDQAINLYEQPERLSERVSLSMSLIDQDHRGTWGDAGIIVEAPSENIVITSPQDVGSMNSDPAFLRQQASQHQPYDGDALLQVSSPSSYNEVVAFSKVDDSKLTIKGVFYKVTSKGEAIDPSVAQKMEMHARKLGVPVVKIKTVGHYQSNEVQEHDEKLAVHLNGNRYLLDGYADGNFRVYDEKMECHFITPEELKPVLQFLREKRFSEDRISTIQRVYESADREYHRAKFKFDENGEVKGLDKREGYASSERRYFIGCEGHAYVVNVEDETRKFKETMMSNGLKKIDENNIYRSISEGQVERMIEEAKERLSPEQLVKVEEWAAKILPDVEQKSQRTYGRSHLLRKM